MDEREHTSYAAWVERLMKALVIVNPDWKLALRGEWRNAFEARGYTPDDLHKALDAIMLLDEIPDTGRALFGALRHRAGEAQRARLAISSRAKRFDADAQFGICETCKNCGQVEVPLLRVESAGQITTLVESGEWRPYRWNRHGDPVFATGSVACRCIMGKRLLEMQKDERKMMSLAGYEHHNPDWRSHMARRDLGDKAERNAEHDTRRVDSRAVAQGIGEMPF